MQERDVWVGGYKYRRISKSDTNFSGYFDDVTNNGYRYFKWERIKWRVLQNDGNFLFVLAENGSDVTTGYDDGVAPALHINLSSDLWSLTDDGSSGGKEMVETLRQNSQMFR